MLSHVAWIILRILYPIAYSWRLEKTIDFDTLGRSGVLLLSNHQSLCDPWKIGPLLPFGRQVHWFAAAELFAIRGAYQLYREDKGPITSIFLACLAFVLVRYSLTIPIEREKRGTNRRSLLAAKKLLEQGRVVGIFPEGGVDRGAILDPTLIKLAIKTGARILPVRLDGYSVRFAEPIDTGKLTNEELESVCEGIKQTIYRK